jgi:hypothetical protein
MPLRKPATPRDKREELKTYQELSLRRDLKSIRARKKVEAAGTKRVLGNASSGEPYLIVDARRYREVRLEIQKKLLLEAKCNAVNLPVDTLLRQLKPRIESLVYAKLAGETSLDAQRHLPVAALGRALTAEEQSHFAAAAESSSGRSVTSSHRALNQVLGQVEQRQTHNPARYQTIWAQVVGIDAAQQSWFDRIDANTQTAWFRCTNSALSYALSRKPDLVKKLSKALGVPIRQLRAKF